jgi:HPr kinase/phosphorylase
MLTPRDFLTRRGDPLQLESLTGEIGLDRQLTDAEVATPGLALAGYTDRFAPNRIHVLGETEITYLRSLSPDVRLQRLEQFFSFDLPLIFVSKKLEVPEEMLRLAKQRGVAILRSALKTADFYRFVKPIVEDAFAPFTTLHGSLADVYGVGMLLVGKSGIGKSECVLDLVERGHRLVADDVVQVVRRGSDILIGRGHELAGHHMEIRGVGLIDVSVLFGIRAVRQQKRIEVVVQLEEWDSGGDVERTGLGRDETEILGVPVPRVQVKLNPGKNITVIAEVVAMNHLLRYSGVDVAQAFNERLIKRMKQKSGVREYLQDDYE